MGRIWPLPQPDAKDSPDPVFLKGHAGPIHAVAVSPDGLRVFTGGEDGTIRSWSADGQDQAEPFAKLGGTVTAIAIDPQGTRLLAGSKDATATLFPLSGTDKPIVLTGLLASVQSVAFSPNGERLAIANAAGGVKICEVSGKGVIAFGHSAEKPSDPPQPIHQVLFSADGTLITASAAKSLKMFTFEGQWSGPKVLGPHVFRVLALDFSPDGTMLASGGGEPSRSGEIKLWDTKTGVLIRNLPETLHSDTVFGLRFSPDGKKLASASGDKFLKIFELASNKEIKSFEGHTSHVLAVDWSEDGKKLATGGADNAVKIWDAESGDQVRTLIGAGKQVTGLQWTRGAGNQAVAGASGDGTVRFWEPNNGNVGRIFRGPTDYLFAVAVSRDRGRVVGGGAEGVLFVWDGANGQVVRKILP